MNVCRESLAGYKRPREFRFIAFEDFPRSTSGKIQRRSLRASYEAGDLVSPARLRADAASP